MKVVIFHPMIRLRDIILPFDHSEDALYAIILEHLDISAEELESFRLVRRSIDARRKTGAVKIVYTVDVELSDEEGVVSKAGAESGIVRSPCMEYRMPAAGQKGALRPVVVGSGPCGLFATIILAELGFRPILIERGRNVGARVRDVRRFWTAGRLDPESNVQFGEGGAGTFSDGKLASQIKDRANRSRKVLEEFVRAGAPEEILYEARPHIGTDNLVRIVKNLRRRIESLGGEVRFETKLTRIRIKAGRVVGAVVNDADEIETDRIVIAPGHSARDTFEMLNQLGIPMEPKAFSIGVRIEHPQRVIDKARYGRFASGSLLPPAEYKLVHHCRNGRSAYTFCMCPGGEVIASSSEGESVVTNGMSLYSRNGVNCNSGLLVGVNPGDFGSSSVLAGVEFQKKWERKAFELGGGNYSAPVQLMGDFLAGRASKSLGNVAPSYRPWITPSDLSGCLPDYVVATLREAIVQMDKKLRGLAMKDAVMTGVETRSSSPVRIVRDDSFQSPCVKGLYPAGEGAGYAGGIISAAVDGIKAAEAICSATLIAV
ncbi:MAG: hypothetical protein JW720_06270 [Sedimentisphaerales bacterium]|nr:hypothetical protein [Sedimentisphaerales bacterium]